MALLCLLLNGALPEESYDGRDPAQEGTDLQQTVETLFESIKRLFDNGVKDTENLRTQGERLPKGEAALSVRSSVVTLWDDIRGAAGRPDRNMPAVHRDLPCWALTASTRDN